MTRPSTLPVRVASALILTNAAVCAIGWWVLPERGWKWGVALLIAPAIWAVIERALGPHDGRRETAAIRDLHRSLIGWVALLVLLASGARVAVTLGLLGADSLDAVQRLRGVVRGAGLLAFGNCLPKLLSPWAAGEEPFDWQKVHRFVGWLFVLGGAATIFGWVILPIESAGGFARTTLLAVLALALARKFSSVIARGRPEASTGGYR